ncbi:hypothetical protein AK89_12805 [Enterococcus mundtii CRL35]|nr:hypothetical protein AK89_12805 [Enterococcus mundtii CRL35]
MSPLTLIGTEKRSNQKNEASEYGDKYDKE